MYSRFRKAELLALTVAIGALGACGRHAETQVPQAPPTRASIQGTPAPTLFPGGGSEPPEDPLAAQYAADENAKTEGKRLYDWYNCAGCHFHGAGGIGPSLGDNDWIYGGSMSQIYSTIHQGRPNGMPSWGAKLSPTEIWELAAYIRDGADKAKSIPIPTTPTEATPIGAARTVDAPSPAITELPPATAKSDAEPPKP